VLLLAAYTLAYIGSGAFVGLAQAALMDAEPDRHEQNMARWTAAGSLGVVTGPLVLGAGLWLGGDWRIVFGLLGVITFALVAFAWQYRFPAPQSAAADTEADDPAPSFRQSFRNALGALRKREVWRWMILLEFSNLMLDILLAYLALYFVDVVGLSEATAVLAISVWTGVGLIGDLLMVALLERVKGLAYLRYSAVIELVLYSAFLLVDSLALKLVCLALLGFFNAGWYAILQAQLYSTLPNQSGSVVALGSVVGLLSSILPLTLGWFADQWGLAAAMWLILAGPISLLVGLPRGNVELAEVED
jgi:FSR family fosmidomycin resistance protein-like MFS transporter